MFRAAPAAFDRRTTNDQRNDVMTGTIKRIVRDRRFGFIRGNDGQEWFFHRSGVHDTFDTLTEGEKVEFDEEPSTKGPRATKVRPLQT